VGGVLPSVAGRGVRHAPATGVMRPANLKLVLRIRRLFAITSLAVLIGACDVNLKTDSRSGTIEDDYVAEPLSSTSLKYESALLNSNLLIDHLKGGDVDLVYSDLFSRQLKETVSKQDFERLFNQIVATRGRITNYKRMQWGFISSEEDGASFIAYVKYDSRRFAIDHHWGL